MITRFAPAPTGHLHLGHVVNALHVWGAARERDGQVLLRIEDHDRQRSRPEYEAAILEDLAWLGFVHDGAVVRQSERDAIYRKALQPLIDRELVLRLHVHASSRSGIGDRDPGSGGGDSLSEHVPRQGHSAHDDVGWRVRMEPGVERFFDELLGPQEQDPSRQCGDLLVRDRLGNWTYQFAVTVDDHLQRITDVIRGVDLLASTGRQIRLARLLGRAAPPRFWHHPLVMKSPSAKAEQIRRRYRRSRPAGAGLDAEQVLEKAAHF